MFLLGFGWLFGFEWFNDGTIESFVFLSPVKCFDAESLEDCEEVLIFI